MDVFKQARTRRRGRGRGRRGAVPLRQRRAALAIGALAGAAGVSALGLLRDRRRRHAAADRLAAGARQAGRRLRRSARATALTGIGRLRGLVHRLARRPGEPLDDAGLAHKVESVLFRDQSVPKGEINVNAENGTVFLRGQVEEPELIRDLEQSVRRISGVREVENLLHLPGTPAPASHGGPKAPPG